MEKVMEKSWNVMEFGFENCVGTLIMKLCLPALLTNDHETFSHWLAAAIGAGAGKF